MRLEDVTAEIRPRTDWEAVDLGFAMARRDFWRCLAVWWLAMLPPLALAGWFLRGMPLLLIPLLWWFKPAGSRMVLFELSRRLFGERPAWKAVLRQIPGAWTRRFFFRFGLARFSPWLPVMLAVDDLEGLRKSAYQRRASQLSMRGDAPVVWIYLLTDLTAAWVAAGLFATGYLMMPEGQGEQWSVAMETFDISRPQDIPGVISWTAVVCFSLGIALTDVFVTGAGFGIYVNNRTWLEGWDVELAFKRLGKRLMKIAAIVLAALTLLSPLESRAQTGDEVLQADTELVKEVKRDPVFKVHEEVRKELKPRSWNWLGRMFSGVGDLAMAMGYLTVAIVIALLVWLVWRNRHVFQLKSGRQAGPGAKPEVKVVMGMQITPDTLPKDIPTRALELWRQGRRHEALALLYRGAISKAIDIGRVDIQESDTEGDCLRRVEQAGGAAHPDYFRGLTGVWMSLAYAGKEPPELEVESLCREWPFTEGRRA